MKSVNFEFLRPANESLAEVAGLAEAVLHIDPGSALTRLRGFAEEVTKAIYKEELLPRLPQATFYELLKDPVFTACTSKPLIYQINALRIQGNETAHGAKGSVRDAKLALGMAHQLAMYMAIKYYGKKKADIPDFQEIPDQSAALGKLKQSVSAYKEKLEARQEEVKVLLDELDRERTKNV